MALSPDERQIRARIAALTKHAEAAAAASARAREEAELQRRHLAALRSARLAETEVAR